LKTAIVDGAETSLIVKEPFSVGIGAFTSKNKSNLPNAYSGLIEGRPSNNFGPVTVKNLFALKSRIKLNPPADTLGDGGGNAVPILVKPTKAFMTVTTLSSAVVSSISCTMPNGNVVNGACDVSIVH
jgi:hypothetical protein